METLQAIRDLALIVLAFETIVVGAAVLFLVWRIWRLVGAVRAHLEVLSASAREILGSVKETAQTTAETARYAQGRVEFVADRAARPVIELYSAIAGASRFARAVFRAGQDRRDGGGG